MDTLILGRTGLEALCDVLGEAPAVVALARVLSKPVAAGPRTVEQLGQNLKVPSLDVWDATLDKLDAIWPGPGGAAPEAYAW
jgi:aryl-alcohol dehydrogenase-like predicted oxidoreductase